MKFHSNTVCVSYNLMKKMTVLFSNASFPAPLIPILYWMQLYLAKNNFSIYLTRHLGVVEGNDSWEMTFLHHGKHVPLNITLHKVMQHQEFRRMDLLSHCHKKSIFTLGVDSTWLIDSVMEEKYWRASEVSWYVIGEHECKRETERSCAHGCVCLGVGFKCQP